MKKLSIFLFWGITFTLSFAQEITLQDIWQSRKYYPDFANDFRWMKNDDFYSEMESAVIEQYSIKDEKKVGTILDINKIALQGGITAKEIESYQFNEDETKVLLIAKSEPIYRHSSKEVCQIWDSKTNKVYVLQNGKPISNAAFSPDGSKVAYVFENNVYFYEMATDKTTQVTKDGKQNEIINGATDWVYEEEFSFAPAFFWSPKSDRIAYYRFNETEVKEFSMDMYGELYPTQYKFKYPKAGEKNSIVDIFIYDIVANKIAQADLGKETDIYVPRIRWTQNNDILAVMRMNRLQNHLDVLHVNATTGKATVMLNETSDTYVEITDDKWTFPTNHPDMLWLSEQNGYNHIYRYGIDGKLIGQITSGDFDVLQIVSIDEKNDKIYYLSTEVSPMEKHLYSIGFDGKNKKRLTDVAGTHDVSFSSACTYYIDSYSTFTNPGKTELRKAKTGDLEKTLVDNERVTETLKKANMGKTEFFSFKTSENVELNGWMIKPKDFSPKKKYPVLMYVYGGPGIQTVTNSWAYSNTMWYHMLAQKGYIVISVDGRGTGGRGAKFKKCTYANLGKLELQDQIEAAKYIKKLPYVNPDRVGIWGWSFGGYMTALCMTKGGDLFKMGISVAPVTNWRFYDTIYTERYLQTPQENAKGYDDNSPINYAKDLQGKYLLVHGAADDNVHFQNSMEWITALVNAGKQFDMMAYPNKNHSIGGGMTRMHLYTKMTDYILNNL